jgi:hypothetical protein
MSRVIRGLYFRNTHVDKDLWNVPRSPSCAVAAICQDIPKFPIVGTDNACSIQGHPNPGDFKPLLLSLRFLQLFLDSSGNSREAL